MENLVMAAAAGTIEVFDLRGLKCPLPVLKTRRRMAALASGSLLAVETTDPMASIDIPHFCHEAGHELVSQDRTDSGHRFVIRRR
jgi:tRNA 2-thiouridine synthesizing protein A